MTRLLTHADPEAARKLRDLVAGRAPAAKRRPASSGKPKALVSQFASFDPRTDAMRVQLPMHLEHSQYNANGAYWRKAKTAKEHVDTTLLALCSMLGTWSRDAEKRARVVRVTFVRLSPAVLDEDNLPSAFKHIKDAVFAWLVNGDAPFNRRAIGHFDRTGKRPCNYEQRKCEANHRAHGIQILLHIS